MARVYEITVGALRYIGHTKNPASRLIQHLSQLERGEHFNYQLQAAFDALGGEPSSASFRYLSPDIPLEAAQAEERRRVSEDPSLLNLHRLKTVPVSPGRALRIQQAEQMREMQGRGMKLREIAQHFGMATSAVDYRIRNIHEKGDDLSG